MGTEKKRIAAYVTEETVKKFKIVSATKGKSMSEYAAVLIEKSIEGYEVEKGTIELDKEKEPVTPVLFLY